MPEFSLHVFETYTYQKCTLVYQRHVVPYSTVLLSQSRVISIKVLGFFSICNRPTWNLKHSLEYLKPLFQSLEHFPVVNSNFSQKSVCREQPFRAFFINRTLYSILNIYQCGYCLFKISKKEKKKKKDKKILWSHHIASRIRCQKKIECTGFGN